MILLMFSISLGSSPYSLKQVRHITLPFPLQALHMTCSPYVMYVPTPSQFGQGTALVPLHSEHGIVSALSEFLTNDLSSLNAFQKALAKLPLAGW